MNDETTIEEKPLTIQQAIDLAVQHHNAGDLSKAEIIYQHILQADPNHHDVLHRLGVISHLMGKNSISADLITKAITIKPDYAEAHSNLGYILKILGQLDEAVASCNNALAIKPDYAEAHNNLGNALSDQESFVEAEASYSNAIAIKPDFAEAYYNRGNVFLQLGEHVKALESYNKAIVNKPDFAEAHSNLGNALKDLGKLDEAVASYSNAIFIKPDYAEAHSNLGNALRDLGMLDEALACYKKVLDIMPNNAEACFNLGRFLYECGRYKQAAEQFKLTGHGQSKSYLLRCLYYQDEQYLFYDQLVDLINKGEINSAIGSLCSRSKIRYGTHNPNPFCDDPLKYILKRDLTKKCDFKKIFIDTVKNILNGDTVSYMSQGLLTNGHQTAGNFFSQKNDLIDAIKNIINTEIENYRDYFKDSEEGFLKKWPTRYSLDGWLISMKSGGKLTPHMHDTWIAGSIYINVPPKTKPDSGNLVLCIDDEEYLTGTNRNPKKSIDVVTGSLCIFPASLLHYTIPFESEEERIVLAFDVLPK